MLKTKMLKMCSKISADKTDKNSSERTDNNFVISFMYTQLSATCMVSGNFYLMAGLKFKVQLLYAKHNYCDL